jgi:hypothetical protein
MPFTLAHPALIIPLNKHLKKWGVLSALIIGSMIPDFSYFLPLGIGRYETHTFMALFWFCLPAGLGIFYLYQLLLYPLLYSILPLQIQQRLDANNAQGKLPTARLSAIALNILIGATTHIIWDIFTHPPHGLPLPISSFMQIVLIQFNGYTFYVFRLLQHLSTFIGIAFIIYWIKQWYVITPPIQQKLWTPPLFFQRFSRLTLLSVPTIAGLYAGYLSASHLIATSQGSTLYKAIMALRDVIIYGGQALLLTWILLGICYLGLRIK